MTIAQLFSFCQKYPKKLPNSGEISIWQQQVACPGSALSSKVVQGHLCFIKNTLYMYITINTVLLHVGLAIALHTPCLVYSFLTF